MFLALLLMLLLMLLALLIMLLVLLLTFLTLHYLHTAPAPHHLPSIVCSRVLEPIRPSAPPPLHVPRCRQPAIMYCGELPSAPYKLIGLLTQDLEVRYMHCLSSTSSTGKTSRNRDTRTIIDFVIVRVSRFLERFF